MSHRKVAASTPTPLPARAPTQPRAPAAASTANQQSPGAQCFLASSLVPGQTGDEASVADRFDRVLEDVAMKTTTPPARGAAGW